MNPELLNSCGCNCACGDPIGAVAIGCSIFWAVMLCYIGIRIKR